MSYVSILRNIPDFLSQPTGIAAIASIGIHGAIAFILPLMPVESKPKAIASSKAVGLVELSQKEQQRLPQTSVAPKVALQPQSPLPKFNSTLPNQSILPPLPPSSSTSLILPQLPKTTYKYPTSSLPKRLPLEIYRGSRFNTGASSYKPYTSAYRNNSTYRRNFKTSRSRNRTINYGNRSKLQAVDPASTIAGMNGNRNYGTSQSNNTVKNKVPNRQLVAPVKSAFQPEGEYTIAAKGGFQEFKPKSPTNATPSPSSSKAIAALNSYTNLREEIQQTYPGIEQKRVIRQVIPTDKTALQGDVTGMLVVDSEGKVVDARFPSDKSISPAQKVAIRKYFLKNPPPAGKNISYYPFSLSLRNSSNVAVDNKIQPGATSTKQSLEQRLRRAKNQQATAPSQPVKIKTPPQVSPPSNSSKNQQATSSNQPVKIKTPPQVSPPSNSSKNQQATSSNQPVKIKTPSQVSPPSNSSKNQQATSSNQPVKIKTPPQVSPSSNSSKKLLNTLRKVRENRQNQD
ncbi:MAG: hypothetical protein QNJ51_00625 [Calothrix sp. MO_167.B12]|nr:hypothetical protein [Calothrix sp. MO_167.B12]